MLHRVHVCILPEQKMIILRQQHDTSLQIASTNIDFQACAAAEKRQLVKKKSLLFLLEKKDAL